ncbi:MAG: hypothetical protein ACTS4U_01115 [Candidatus Hodgkinia cicadicola]
MVKVVAFTLRREKGGSETSAKVVSLLFQSTVPGAAFAEKCSRRTDFCKLPPGTRGWLMLSLPKVNVEGTWLSLVWSMKRETIYSEGTRLIAMAQGGLKRERKRGKWWKNEEGKTERRTEEEGEGRRKKERKREKKREREGEGMEKKGRGQRQRGEEKEEEGKNGREVEGEVVDNIVSLIS